MANCNLHGVALEASNAFNDPAEHLISKPMFKISMDDEDDHCVVIRCYQNCCINKDLFILESNLDLRFVYRKVIHLFVYITL